jgi:Ni,Fe-hydrogenase III large subunit
MEALSGDTSIGHATAYCQAIEALAGCAVPIRGQVLRGIALELERLANHTGDLGALASDVAFLPTAAYCGRLRGDFLNLTAVLTGSRFGRGLLRPGGVAADLSPEGRQTSGSRLENASLELANAVALLWDAPDVQARFENTGKLALEACLSLGMVGPAARACGVETDVRHDFPTGIFFARACVRWLEIQRSLTFIKEHLHQLPEGPIRAPCGPLKPDHLVVTLTEGWRGQICHVALTGDSGRVERYKVVDPSFHNWPGVAMALRNEQISDFPLCNKSFNLSYCGHDL